MSFKVLHEGQLVRVDAKLVRRVVQDGVVGLARAIEAMETLLELSLEDASGETLRQVESVCNLAELAGTLTARLQAKLARHGYVSNPLLPLKDRLPRNYHRYLMPAHLREEKKP